MTDAPERIYVGGEGGEGNWWSHDSVYARLGEYRRADLPPKVKPLEWEYHPAGAIAAPPTGFAYIIDTRMKGRVYSLKGFNPPREFASMDDAKAAAQADYEIRVLSALEGYSPRNPA